MGSPATFPGRFSLSPGQFTAIVPSDSLMGVWSHPLKSQCFWPLSRPHPLWAAWGASDSPNCPIPVPGGHSGPPASFPVSHRSASSWADYSGLHCMTREPRPCVLRGCSHMKAAFVEQGRGMAMTDVPMDDGWPQLQRKGLAG